MRAARCAHLCEGGNSVKLPTTKAKLLEGKKGLIVGIANDQSIGWGCAKAFRALGAELAVTYLNEESAVRYIAAELGPSGIRVHAISPGPLATRAASGIPEFDALLEKAKAKAPAKAWSTSMMSASQRLFWAHDSARLITGETLYIDGGYHIMD
jgi:enoyl-[acyl-carrier-protein] reductase (NADH)